MRFALLCVAAAAALSVGCFSRSIGAPMQAVPSPSTSAPPGVARLLIVRPSRGHGGMVIYHVTDGQTAYLGDSINNSVFAVDLAPGHHDLCIGVFGGAAPVLKGDLTAGKTYIARVDIGFGGASLAPVLPNTDDMKEILAELPGLRGAKLIGPSAEDALTASDVTDQYARCVEASKGNSPNDNAKLLLREGDSL